VPLIHTPTAIQTPPTTLTRAAAQKGIPVTTYQAILHHPDANGIWGVHIPGPEVMASGKTKEAAIKNAEAALNSYARDQMVAGEDVEKQSNLFLVAGEGEDIVEIKLSEFGSVTIRCTNREAIRFKGRLIAETEWETRHQSTMRFEIWETAGGALIGVIDGDIPGEDKAEVSAHVALPGDEFEQRIEVMRFFDFHDRARSMVRQQLKWRLVREVA
jgi:predicted RNase H-like HicB family nuclease